MSAGCDVTPMITRSGTGIFFDGVTSARQDAEVELAPEALRIRTRGGRIVAEWPYAELEHLSAPESLLRLGRFRNPVSARLEVTDPDFAHAIDELATTVDRTGITQRKTRRRVIVWSI